MIRLLRISVIVSLVAALAVAVIPFDRPHEATFPVTTPPAAPFLVVLGALVTVVLLAISAYGLFRFRHWAPRLAAVTVVLLAALATLLVVAPDLTSVVSVAAKSMALLSAMSLALAVILTRTRAAKDLFRVAL